MVALVLLAGVAALLELDVELVALLLGEADPLVRGIVEGAPDLRHEGPDALVLELDLVGLAEPDDVLVADLLARARAHVHERASAA